MKIPTRISTNLIKRKKAIWLWAKRFPRSQGTAVLVAGMQRSGTNMLMDILERNKLTTVYHESDRKAFDNYHLKDIAEIRALHEASRAPFFVFKVLLESHRVNELQAFFPGAKSIWMYRDFRDVVNSHMVSWPGFREHLDEIVVDRSAGGWRSRGLTDDAYRLLQEHYRPDLSVASCVALFWYLRNTLLFSQGLEQSPDTVIIEYEWLVSNPATAVSAVCTHLGMPYTSAMHSFVHTRSISKRKEPDIEPSIKALCEAMSRQLAFTAKDKLEHMGIAAQPVALAGRPETTTAEANPAA